MLAQVLCSVAGPRAVAKQLYRLLKPGGELIFFEHHRSADWLACLVQCASELVRSYLFRGWLLPGLWTLVWPSVVGGCRLNRPTREIYQRQETGPASKSMAKRIQKRCSHAPGAAYQGKGCLGKCRHPINTSEVPKLSVTRAPRVVDSEYVHINPQTLYAQLNEPPTVHTSNTTSYQSPSLAEHKGIANPLKSANLPQ